jgi:phospholipase/carboxylesterase
MNRLSPHTGLGSLAPSHSTLSGECSLFSTSDAAHLRYALFAPVHYEKNYDYPLLIWLHGAGHDEQQLLRIMPLISMRNYVAVAPRGPCASRNLGGYEWRTPERGTAQATQLVFDCQHRVAQHYHIGPDRIFLAGLHAGGDLALRIALRHPDRFAGVISINGAFPRDSQPLGELSAARRLPILLAHGKQSRQYPEDQLCDDVRLFHAAAMCVDIRQYPVADEIHQLMLSDMNVWIMERVTGQRLSQTQFIVPGLHRQN